MIPPVNDPSIAGRVRLDLVRYANCWEDADLVVAALQPAPGRRMLSIASGGDNAFALLAEGAEVVAADLSAAQLALVELKAAAVRALDRDGTLAFLGIAASAARRDTYAALRADLTPAARAFWDARSETVERGIVHGGKIERYFALFRRVVLRLVHRRRTIDALLVPRDAAARERFYAERWDTWRWRLLFRLFFSRFVLGRLGRDPELFRHVEGTVAETLLARTRYALTTLPVDGNPYVEYIVRGTFRDALPRWLRPEVYPRVREGLPRLVLHHGGIDEAAAAHADAGAGRRGFDGFNLSDLFEYLDTTAAAALYRRLLEAARPGARLAYWNLLVPRRAPAELAARVRSLDAEAARLFAGDQAFVYGAFVLEEAIGGGETR